MLTPSQMKAVEPKIRLLQVIAAALIMGVLACGMVFAILVDWNLVNTKLGLLVILGAVIAAVLASIGIWLPHLTQAPVENLRANQVTSVPQDAWLEMGMHQYQTISIVRFALFEGAAFLNFVVFLIEQSLPAMIVSLLMVVLMIWLFPRASMVYAWLEKNLPDPVEDR